MSEEARSCHRTAVVIALFAFKAEKARAEGRGTLRASFDRIPSSRYRRFPPGIPLWLRLPLIKADRLANAITNCTDATSKFLSLSLPRFYKTKKLIIKRLFQKIAEAITEGFSATSSIHLECSSSFLPSQPFLFPFTLAPLYLHVFPPFIFTRLSAIPDTAPVSPLFKLIFTPVHPRAHQSPAATLTTISRMDLHTPKSALFHRGVPRPLHSTFPLTPLPLLARPFCNFRTRARFSSVR